jgi:hypothetical protein
MRMIAKVRFNQRYAWVIDDPINLQYTFYENKKFLIGLDETCTFYNVLYYERPTGNMRAFGGRSLDLPMADGSVTHCDGQYWSGKEGTASKILGVSFGYETVQSIEQLRECYVFSGYAVNYERFLTLCIDYDGPVFDYYEYEAIIKCKNSCKYKGNQFLFSGSEWDPNVTKE